MRSAPKKSSNEEALYTAALRALGRRSYSVFEMRSYLERRSEDPSLARNVVARLRQQRLIDDARYALDFARHHSSIRRQGRYRIARELRARGVPDRYITDALDKALEDTDEALVVRKLIERRLRAAASLVKEETSEGKKNFDSRKMNSLYRRLLRAGFDSQLIRRELGKVAKTASFIVQENGEDLADAAEENG
jgi:regulatory protein